MGVTNILDDWQIKPTTTTENAEAQKAMAAKQQETTPTDTTTEEAEEETTTPSYMDTLTQVWSPRLQTGAARVASAVQQMASYDKVRQEAEEKLKKASENKTSVYQAILEEQKPVRKEEEEKMLRNRALIKGFGDVASAIASGVHAYGKRGAGVVPTLAENSPLKDIEKLNALRAEYLKRKEAWKALDMKLRMSDADAKSTEAKEAYKNALERMKDAQKVYQDALTDYDTLARDYTKDVTRSMDTELKEDRADARAQYNQTNANYRAGLRANGTPKDAEKKETARRVDIYNKLGLYKPRDVKNERYDEEGNLEGYIMRKSTYSEDLKNTEANALVSEYVDAVIELMDVYGYKEEDAVAAVKEEMRKQAKAFHDAVVGMTGHKK